MFAELNNKEEMIKNLEKAFEYGKKKDELTKEEKILTHKSILGKGYECDPSKWTTSNELSHVELIKERINEYAAFKKYFNDKDFTN